MNLEKINMAQWESVLVVGSQQFAQIGHLEKPSFVNISFKTQSI